MTPGGGGSIRRRPASTALMTTSAAISRPRPTVLEHQVEADRWNWPGAWCGRIEHGGEQPAGGPVRGAQGDARTPGQRQRAT